MRENSNYIFLLFIAKKNINGIIANVTFRFSLGTLLFDFTHALEKCTTWKNGIFFILRINIKTPVNNPFFLEFLIRICMFQTLSFVSGFPFYWRRRRRRWHWKCFLISFKRLVMMLTIDMDLGEWICMTTECANVSGCVRICRALVNAILVRISLNVNRPTVTKSTSMGVRPGQSSFMRFPIYLNTNVCATIVVCLHCTKPDLVGWRWQWQCIWIDEEVQWWQETTSITVFFRLNSIGIIQ